MPELAWIKKSTRTYDDDKIKLIETMPDADALLVIWDKLLIQAGKINHDGWVFMNEKRPYTEEMLAAIFNRPVNTIRLALQTFQDFGMIEKDGGGIFVTNFAKYHDPESLTRGRDLTRRRVQKHRALKQLQAGNVTVTLRNATEEEVDIDKEKEKEKENLIQIIKEGRLNDVLINGVQSLYTIREVLSGRREATELNKKAYQQALDKMGITLEDLENAGKS